MGDGARCIPIIAQNGERANDGSVFCNQPVRKVSWLAQVFRLRSPSSLKGKMDNQNYDIPSDVDLTHYRRVPIYCLPFHVVFSTATLAR